MSLLFATQLTAVATLALAVLALATAVLALLAWRKQSREVSDQAEMLALQRRQLEVQREDSAKQAEVLELQAADLRESLEERKREAEERRRSQATRVFLTEKSFPGREGRKGLGPAAPDITATVVNSSSQPIYDVEFAWLIRPTTHVERSPADEAGPNPDRLDALLPGQHAERTCAFAIGVTVRFTDAAGIRWVRRTDGYFTEQG